MNIFTEIFTVHSRIGLAMMKTWNSVLDGQKQGILLGMHHYLGLGLLSSSKTKTIKNICDNLNKDEIKSKH